MKNRPIFWLAALCMAIPLAFLFSPSVSSQPSLPAIPWPWTNATGYLYSDGNYGVSWQPVTGAGLGNVTGPAASTNDHIALFADATGMLIKDSDFTIAMIRGSTNLTDSGTNVQAQGGIFMSQEIVTNLATVGSIRQVQANVPLTSSPVTLGITGLSSVFQVTSDDPVPANRVLRLGNPPSASYHGMAIFLHHNDANGATVLAADANLNLRANWSSTSVNDWLALMWDATAAKWLELWRVPAYDAFTTGTGVTNTSNVLSLNLNPGANVTFTTNGSGSISIASSGGGAGTNAFMVFVNGSEVDGPNFQDVTGGITFSAGGSNITAVLPTTLGVLNGIGAGASGEVIWHDGAHWTNSAANPFQATNGTLTALPSAVAVSGTTNLNVIGGTTTDNLTVTNNANVLGTLSGDTLAVADVTITNPIASLKVITGAFDSIDCTNKFTNQVLTASQAVVTAADKSLASVAYTGAGNVMRTRTGVYRHIWVPAGAMTPTTTSPATASTNSPATTTDLMTSDTWDFSGSASNCVNFTLTLPDSWAAGTVKAKFYWKEVVAASGKSVCWGIAGGSVASGDTLGNTLGTLVWLTNACANDTNKMTISAATAAVTIGSTPAAGDLIWFRVQRLPEDAGDDDTELARLFGVEIQYLESATETATW